MLTLGRKILLVILVIALFIAFASSTCLAGTITRATMLGGKLYIEHMDKFWEWDKPYLHFRLHKEGVYEVRVSVQRFLGGFQLVKKFELRGPGEEVLNIMLSLPVEIWVSNKDNPAECERRLLTK